MIENIRELVAFIADNNFTIKIEAPKYLGWKFPDHELVIEAYGDSDVKIRNKTTGDIDWWGIENFKCHLESRKWSLIPEYDTTCLFPNISKKQEKKLLFIEFSDKLKEWHDNFKLIQFEENGRIDTFEIQWWGRGCVTFSSLYENVGSLTLSPHIRIRQVRDLHSRYKEGEFKFLDDTFETYKEKMEQEK